MAKFKVGDKVKVVGNENGGWAIGTEGEIISISGGFPPIQVESNGESWYHTANELELIDLKPSKNQRITALEKTVQHMRAELDKAYEVEQDLLKRVSALEFVLAGNSKLSTDVIEFEGKQYKKVAREAREGDVVVFDFKVKRQWGTTSGKPYKVIGDHHYIDDEGGKKRVYGWHVSCPDPNIYELVAEEKQKTPNQQRAEIIEKAKAFKKEHKGDYKFCKQDNLIVAFNAKYDGRKVGYACCNPSDVFNVHIGKAIALGRALGLDVSEFEQAVQPTVAEIGSIIEYDGYQIEIKPKETWCMFTEGTATFESHVASNYKKIINDTNAIYGGVK